jgi:hypothetical protein
MNKDSDSPKKVDRNIVLAAIKAIKDKGWDLNPYTVADEADIPRALIYRNAELMELIIQERGGTFGMDLDTSLNLARQIQELEQELGELKDNVKQLKLKFGASSTRLQSQRLEQAQAGESMVLPKSQQVKGGNGEGTPVTANKQSNNGQKSKIFNAASAAPYLGSDSNPLLNLTWKDIETVYHMKVKTLVDYGRNIPAPAGETQAGWPTDDSEIIYRPFPTREAHETKVAGLVPPKGTPPTDRRAPVEDAPRPSQSGLFQQLASDWPGLTGHEEKKVKPPAERLDSTISPFQALKSTSQPASQFDQAQARQSEDAGADQSRQVIWEAEEIHQDLLDQRLEARDIAEAVPPPAKLVDFAGQGMEERLPGAESSGKKAEMITPPSAVAGAAALETDSLSTSAEGGPDDLPYSDFNLAGPHYSFGTPYGFGFSAKGIPAAPVPEPISDEAYVDAYTRQMSEEGLHQATPDAQIVETVPDLEALDIFDDLDQLTELEEIEIIEDVLKTESAKGEPGQPTTISGDELRELIKSRIKQAAEQLAEPPPEKTPALSTSEPETSKKRLGRNKFVGAAKAHEPQVAPAFTARSVPAEIRKACLLLGVRPEEITREMIQDAWKRQIASPGVHPDQGGDTESAIYLNTAKDTLLRWLEAQAPKLGKRFGQTVKTRAQQSAKDNADKSE